MPATIETKTSYLFYLHGRIIENQGIRPTDPRYGVYEYEEILRTLAGRGFAVISEARAKDTDVNQYANKVVQQVNTLINAGVPPSHITVLGASKGSVITMRVSTLLRNKDVNFVVMSNCNDWVDQNFQIDLYGNVLSIYDINDEFGETCQKFFDKASGLNRRKEVVLKVGTGHAVLYKPLKEWVDLVVEWAKP
ncbi:MAG TPA: alpha/beta hydrolase [Pyrinomonadaceae bacterium]|nr:alpha/beta hydrolase [Pyrinomonadaceae bacterium]